MKTLKLNVTKDPGLYVVSEPGDQTGEYVRADVARGELRRRVLRQIAETAGIWHQEHMAEHLRGARTFAICVLTDAETNSTEAERLVDEAIAARKALEDVK